MRSTFSPISAGVMLLCLCALPLAGQNAAGTQAPTPASSTAAAPSQNSSASSTAASDTDKNDDDDQDVSAAPQQNQPGGKSAPQKHGIFGPKKLPWCKPGQTPGPNKVCRIKLPRMTPVNISDGTLTVNGMIAKVRLNYQIADLKYLYFWVPGLGIISVTDKPFPNGKEQPGAFHGKGLTVKVNGQTIELFSDALLLKNDRKKQLSAWVVLDPGATPPAGDPHFKSPNFGWGATPGAPYSWPGSLPPDPKKHALAPPVPAELQPIIAKPAPKPVPVSISSALPSSSGSTAPAAAPATQPAATPPQPAATPAPSATSTPPASK